MGESTLKAAGTPLPRASETAGPSPITGESELTEEGPSLRDAARSLYARRHDPDLEVDMRIATPMSGLLWIGGSLLCLAMLALAPPDQTLGAIGWLIAGILLAAGIAIGLHRLLGAQPSGFGALFAATMMAVVAIALLEWLAGGRTSPYHQLYALPVIYAATVQPRRRAMVGVALVGIVMWAPLLYSPPARQLPADIAGQLMLLVVLALAARIVFTVLRGQRSVLRRTREQAHQLARRDALTGLGNRLRLEETLSVEVARARRQDSPLSLIIGDLDGFKAINDAAGHAGGDECLRRVAAAVGEASRTEDQCFRWGGDEFVVVLPETSAAEAAEVRRRVCTAASRAYPRPGGGTVRLTCGTAELGPDDDVTSLLAAADQMLFRFKQPADRVNGDRPVGASSQGSD